VKGEKMKTNLLKSVLAERGMTAKELANKIGMDKSVLSLRMTNKREFKASEIAKIIDVLRLSNGEAVAIFLER
jgi:DNA-binding Xre family transcriptional regulator